MASAAVVQAANLMDKISESEITKGGPQNFQERDTMKDDAALMLQRAMHVRPFSFTALHVPLLSFATPELLSSTQ